MIMMIICRVCGRVRVLRAYVGGGWVVKWQSLMCVGLCFCDFPFEILGSGAPVDCRILVSHSKAGVWFVRFVIICELIVDVLAGVLDFGLHE
jgi:hypothetical protein